MDFENLNLMPPLLRAVADVEYKTPSPIQEKAIPPVLAGRDLLACAQTGTGKTAAFALPILQLLSKEKPAGKKKIRTLVLTPTRELALQIQESFEAYAKYLPLRSTVVFGGVNQGPQVAALKNGVDVLVATPGRLNDLIGQGHINLSHIEIFVLDEADRMLDMGFVHDVKKVIRLLPAKRQTLLFSATMPKEIVVLASSLLQRPAKVFVTPVSSTVESISQCVYKVDKLNKRHLLAQLLQSMDVASALVFTRTKHGADRVVRELSRAGVKAMAIHGNKSQNARQNALSLFKKGDIKVLVATDIAARGLDINELSHVFNYDLPNIPETYVHRIGRTGRAGHGGTAISFCNYDELPYLTDIQKLIGFTIDEVKNHPWPMAILQKAEKAQTGPGAHSNAQGRGPKVQTPQSQKQRGEKAMIPTKKQPKKVQPAPAQEARPAQQKLAQAAKAKPAQNKNAKQPAAKSGRGRDKNKRPPFDPYENLTGGKAIITKRPIWADSEPGNSGGRADKGDDTMARNNNRRRGGKNRSGQNNRGGNTKQGSPLAPKKETPPPIPKNEHGVFDFSEEELAEDSGIKVISRTSAEAKYASFEDFLKDH